jgi:hypothetical protein
MSNINLNLPETATKLVEPVSKLIDAMSGAIGKIYEPIHIKLTAKARAEEIKTIAETIRKNSDIPIVYNQSKNVSIDTSSYEELAKRAGNRVAFQEVKKQQNIETVANKTCDLLKNGEKVSDEPVDQDWMTRFINSIEDISNDEMQNIWAKILAGEIKKPKTFSLRTLEAVKNLSSDEAKEFEKLSQYLLTSSKNTFLPNDNKLLEKHGINYSTILKLEECGLITSNAMLAFECNNITNTEPLLIYNSHILIIIKGKDEKQNKISIPSYLLQSVGEQLFHIVKTKQNVTFAKDFAINLREKNTNLLISAHEINSIKDNQIDSQQQDLLPVEPSENSTNQAN